MLIRRHQEVYGNTVEINEFYIIMVILLIILMITFKFKQKITGQTGNGSTKVVEIMVPFKYLSNFWRTLQQMPLINCEISLQFKWSTIISIIFETLIFYQIFPLPQVKRCAIITYKHGTFELPNDFRLRILGNQEILGESLNIIE